MEVHINFLPASEPVLSELSAIQQEMNAVRMQGFTEEERGSYETYRKRVRENTFRAFLS